MQHTLTEEQQERRKALKIERDPARNLDFLRKELSERARRVMLAKQELKQLLLIDSILILMAAVLAYLDAWTAGSLTWCVLFVALFFTMRASDELKKAKNGRRK